MAEDKNIYDPYVRQQKRLRDLYEDMSTDEDVEDPYADSTGEYGSDENYVPSEQSGSSTTPSDESEMSDLEELTSSAVRAAKKYKTDVMQQDTSGQSTGVTQTKDTLQNIGSDISEHQQKSDEGITQQTSEHQEGLDEDIARKRSRTRRFSVGHDIPDFNFNEATNRLKIDINPNASPQDVFEYLEYNIEGKHLIRSKKHDNRRQENFLYELEASTSQSSLEGHWPERIEGDPSAKSNKKKVFLKCRMCTKNGLRKEIGYRCKGCLNTPPLCPECFEEWHKSQAK